MQNSLRQKGSDQGRELGVTCMHGGSEVGYVTVYELPSPLSTLFDLMILHTAINLPRCLCTPVIRPVISSASVPI